MADWNPDLYRRFESERTRPAAELLGRVPSATIRVAVDLGCGPGNSTQLLVERYPDARILGVDSSEAMIEAARKRLPAVAFEHGDVATWQPATSPDLLYANAVLQWVPDHPTLLPQLFSLLAPGGILALQMPLSRAEPLHRLMRETAASGPWAERVKDADRTFTLDLPDYYDLLAPDAASIDLWRTVYAHIMATPAAIVDWISATGLRPYLDLLDPMEKPEFLARYEAAIAAAYPPRADGRRLLMFPRLFLIAVRPS